MLSEAAGTSRQYAYSLFGLTLHSELFLPELLNSECSGTPDLTIVRGVVPKLTAGEAEYVAIDGGVAFWVDGIGRYAVMNGDRIIVQAELGAVDRNIRLYLLGSAIGMSLHQRGLLPLHANAIEIGGKAFAFMGHSGSGKSTLAAWFHQQRCRIIADDVCVVRFGDEGRPLVSPGLPRLRLWREALNHFGRDIAAYERSYSGDDGIDKYDFPIPPDGAATDQIELGGVFLLDVAERFDIVRMDGVAAADAIFANTYRGASVAMTDSMTDYWKSCVQLVQTTPLFRVNRRWGFPDFDSECSAILDYVERLGS